MQNFKWIFDISPMHKIAASLNANTDSQGFYQTPCDELNMRSVLIP